MGNKILTHDEALNLIYNTIATLRAEGKAKITVTEVAKVSGVNRSTVNSNHVDWVEVRDIIQNNKPSPRAKMASHEIQEKKKWQIEASGLERKLQTCQEDIVELSEYTESLLEKVFEQLHKYVYLSKKVPGRMEKESKNLIELQESKKLVEYYEAEISNLKANSLQNVTVLPFVQKEIVDIYFETPRVNVTDFIDLTVDAMDKLDIYFKKSLGIGAVYVLCGNFSSGKSTWISKHKPLFRGTNLYIDGTNHSIFLRKYVIKYIRKLKIDCKIICVRLRCDITQCLKRNTNDTRVRSKCVVSDELIKSIGRNFEEVSVNEGFDEIIIVG